MKETICKASVTALLALLILSAMCATAAADYPATWDWRDMNGTNYVTPVRDQEQCGCCWAFPPVGIVESNILIEHTDITNIDLSEQYYVSPCWGLGNCDNSVEGASFHVLKHCMNCGTMSEACMPYIGSSGQCDPCTNWEADAWRIETYGSVSYATETLKTQIMSNGPVMATIYIDEWYYPACPTCNHYDHCVILVGWNDSVGDGCWIVKNSWGTGWGDDGYGYTLYEDVSSIGAVYGSYKVNWNEWDDDCVIADAELSLACWHWCTNTPIHGHLITDAEMSLLVYQWQTGDVY